MYQIKQGDYVLYDLRDEDLILENPQLDLEVNKVGSLSFSIYPNHPHFDKLNKLTSKLTVLKDGTVIFMGRMISDEQGLYNNKKIECEGALGYLNDSIVRPYSFSGTPEEHFTNLFNNHNEQVRDEQKLKIGIITVTDKRGRTASTSGTFNVTAYASPTITNFKVVRSDASGNENNAGTYAKINLSASITALSNKNTKMVKLLKKVN